MLDGKMLRGLTGTPMRRMALANSSLADAEPEPLTLANLTTKSLVDATGTWVGFMRGLAVMPTQRPSPLQRYSCPRPRPLAATPRSRMRLQQHELLDRQTTRLNFSQYTETRMPSSASEPQRSSPAA